MDTGFDQNACLFELAVAYKRLGHMVITVTVASYANQSI